MKKTLLVMAAGMGSRFGGLKQIEPVGANGEIIIDYSIFDAKRAGFDKAVFVIKRDFEGEFREMAGKRIEKMLDIDYVFQTTDNLPAGRVKPWGTGEAVLCARNVVDTPFCVINADDFYGCGAFEIMNEHLEKSDLYAMAGFLLKNTLTENGTVARGICDIHDGYLESVVEHTAISTDNSFPDETVASMNFWGFMPNIFDYLSEQFVEFTKAYGNDLKREFFIPAVVDSLIKSGKEKVRVLPTTEKWYGVTYREDLEGVRQAISKITEEGKYAGI